VVDDGLEHYQTFSGVTVNSTNHVANSGRHAGRLRKLVGERPVFAGSSAWLSAVEDAIPCVMVETPRIWFIHQWKSLGLLSLSNLASCSMALQLASWLSATARRLAFWVSQLAGMTACCRARVSLVTVVWDDLTRLGAATNHGDEVIVKRGGRDGDLRHFHEQREVLVVVIGHTGHIHH
jgi:hypothetical protein